MSSILKSAGRQALQVVVASFIVIPVVVTALLLPLGMQDSERNKLQSKIPITTKIAVRGRVNDQRGSPLFSVLPPELRNRIFRFACTAYETIPYSPNDYFYRPGYHAHRRISTTLLATCKRIYLETYTLPLRLNEHVFWGSLERGPPRRYSGFDNAKRTDLNAFFDCLTPHQLENVQELHLFAQQFWLEDLDLSSDRITTRKIKITLRHQDWYYWEDDESLGICPWISGRVEADEMISQTEMVPSLPKDLDGYVGWGRQFEFVRGLEEVEMEFETLRSLKELEMDPIVAFAKRWQFPLMGNGVLEWDEASGTRESTWTGRKVLKSRFEEPTTGYDEADFESFREEVHEADDLDYEVDTTCEYSDLEDDLPSVAEDEDGVAENTEPAASSELETGSVDVGHNSNQYDSTGTHDATDRLRDLTNDQELTLHATYEPPQIDDDDDDDASEVEGELPGSVAAWENGQEEDTPPVSPLLALESNMQDYYVVSMLWRRRK